MAHGPANGGVPVGIGASNTVAYWSSPTVLAQTGITLSGNNVVFPGNVTFTKGSVTPSLSNYFDKVIYNILDHGVAFDGATDDTSAWNAAFAAIPDGSLIVLPPGTSKISGTIAIPSGKHMVLMGAGPNKTIISTSSATLDMVTTGDWQSEFHGIEFTSSVTRTAGYAINASAMVDIFVTNCNFVNCFNGILMDGTICYIRECNFANTVNFSVQFNGGNVNSFVQGCTFDCSPATVAHIEVNLCGSLLIDNCDIIHATNNLRINPTSSGAFSIYATNTFFDTAAGSSVKCVGTSDIQRLKLTNCWMSGSVNGLEFAGATGNNSTTGVDIVNCDIYSNSANGILATNVRDFSVSNCRIANNTTAGINVTAGAGSGITKFIVQNSTVGPTGIGVPGTGANGTGILIAAGTYGGYIITGNNVSGNTTANINDGGSVTGFNQKQVQDNVGHFLLGKLDAAITTPGAFNTTETIVAGGLNVSPLPANCLTPKNVFRFRIWGTATSTVANATTVRIRIGTAGTTADTAVWTGVSPVAAAAGTTIPFEMDGIMTIRTVGAAATVQGSVRIHNQSLTSNSTASTGIMVFSSQVVIPTFATFNSTVNNYVSLTMVTGATTTTLTINGSLLELI